MKLFKKVLLALYRRARRYEREAYITGLKQRGLCVGKNLTILNEVIIDESHCWHISMGNDVTLAPRVHILAHDASTKTFLGYTKIGKVTIGNRVFIGASTIVLPGVTIGDDVIIGAGSVVHRDIPSKSVVVGNPAKVVGTLDTFVAKKTEEMKKFPLFGEEYTMRKSITEEMKKEMNIQMKNKFAYVV